MTTNTNAALRNALIEAQAGLEFAAARLPQTTDFVPSHIAALKIVNAALTTAAAVPAAHDCCNSWFASLPEGRQAVLRDDKWTLAHAAFDAGRAAAPKAEPLEESERWNPMEGGNPETALQMAAVIAHRDAQAEPVPVELADNEIIELANKFWKNLDAVETETELKLAREVIAADRAMRAQAAPAPNAALYDPREVAFTAQAAPQPAVQQGDASLTMPKNIEMMATNRYRPVPSGVLAYKVVGGDGNRSLFSGTKDECQIVARKLTEAFLDGAHVALAAHPAAPVAQGDAPTDSGPISRQWLTVVYLGVEAGDEVQQICTHPKVSAMSWSHALHDRDVARSQAKEGA